jgi:hypothetical protein
MKLKELIGWYLTHNGDVVADEIVDVVTDWLKTHHREETKYDADYNAGWNDCLDELKGKLR